MTTQDIAWLPDGTPYSQRFGDRYQSEQALVQAREVFLHGCGLPLAWAGAAQWRILETGFGFGLNFLATWAAWRADPERPRLLHFISLEAWPVSAADLLRAAARYPELLPLAQELQAQYWGLLPGVHRLWFEGGRVLLTLCIGDAQALLRQQRWDVDAVYLDGFSPQCNPDLWNAHTLKAVARCCHRGTRLATWTVARAVRDALVQCGFTVEKVPGALPKRDKLCATFDPAWEPRARRTAEPAAAPPKPARCIVIGAGLAGAASAASLARRGWSVRVLDAADAPASGASGLPAGVFAPHLSPDDNLFSRVSRSGVRAMLQQSAQLLQAGVDWSPSGVLESRPATHLGLPADWHSGPGTEWSQRAEADRLHLAGLAPQATAIWHARAGWARPARLVAALLGEPGIAWQAGANVARLECVPSSASSLWRALDAQGRTLAEAELVVLAAGPACNALLAGLSAPPLPLQSVRGQLSWGVQGAEARSLPAFPVNGHGALVAQVPLAGGGHAWHAGSTFERDVAQLPLSPEERAAAHARNWQHLAELLPGSAATLQAAFDPAACDAPGAVQAWAGVRCTAHDRLPIVGPVNAAALPGLWVCTAMGARGLTRAVLCGELLAAQLHGEPLPLETRLARAMSSERCLPETAQIPSH